MAWTDERVEQLKVLWADGLSASQIANKLGGATRNAVIGKVHRLGLSRRAKPSATTARSPKAVPQQRRSKSESGSPRPAPSQPVSRGNVALDTALDQQPEVQTALHPETATEPQSGPTTILQLTEHTCRWPIGDPGTEEFHFCGQRPRIGAPYCELHARVAYQTATSRGNRRDDDKAAASA